MSNVSDFLGGAPGLWVTGTAYAIGKVVLSPADFQYYVRKTNGAGASDPSADAANWKITGNAIKSIQRGVMTTIGGSGSATVTAVNMSKTELRYTGGSDASGIGTGMPRLTLSNATTITAVGGGGGSPGSAGWELTERY